MMIGRRFWEAELEDVDGLPYAEVVQKYCERLRGFKKKGVGLFLWGDNSLGKTHVAAVILKEAVRCGFSAMLVQPSLYAASLVEGSAFDEEQTIGQRCETVDFLCLDDLGKEYAKAGSGWFELNLERLLRLRSKELLVTMVTTNMAEKEFGERYTPSIRALSTEMLFPVNVKGRNFRADECREIRQMMKE